MDIVATIKVASIPIDESLTGPRPSKPHRVMIKNHPCVSFGYTTLPLIYPRCDSLVSKITGIISNLICRNQIGPIVHLLPWDNLRWSRPTRVTFG